MRRDVSRYVSKCAYRDVALGESVNTLSESDLRVFMRGCFGAVDQRISVFMFKQGEVLSNPRGEGSLQRVDSDA